MNCAAVPAPVVGRLHFGRESLFCLQAILQRLAELVGITVDDGGFLAFIVKGTVTIGSTTGYGSIPFPFTVTQPTPNRFTDPNLTGVFITNSTMTTEGNVGIDNQLIAAGTYVAQSFLFKRDLNDYNSSHPGELFIYRPDLWRNAPRALKELPINWQEVAP